MSMSVVIIGRQDLQPGLSSRRVFRLDNQSMKNPAFGSIHELHEMHMIFTLAFVPTTG